METINLPEVVVDAHFRLIALNFESWKPDIAEWLHSEQAETELQQLLALVPCSATIH